MAKFIDFDFHLMEWRISIEKSVQKSWCNELCVDCVDIRMRILINVDLQWKKNCFHRQKEFRLLCDKFI